MRTQTTEIVSKAEPATPQPDTWAEATWLPCRLSVELPVPGLTVGDLLKFDKNSIIDTHQSDGNTLPIWVNGVMIGWAEFDVVAKGLAIRVTDLR